MVDAKETERTNGSSQPSSEAPAVETIARKVGSAIGEVVAKVTGSQTSGDEKSGKPGKSAASQRSKPSNAYEARRYEIKKKKKTAHRRRLKGSNTKG